MRIELPPGGALTLEPIVRTGRRLALAGFDPCMVLLNNDLSAGVPAILQNIDQLIAPPLEAGWYNRRKSHHFTAYHDVARTFAEMLGIDSWLLDPYFAACGEINFQERSGEECLAANVAMVLHRIGAKYAEYGIAENPFVIVKADAGTYGMGIMTVRDAADVVGLNRRQRNKMAVGKEGLAISSVMIQEGVPTFESIHEALAEPVVYIIDRFVVGGSYRVHTARGKDENLNAPGAQFLPLACETPCIPDLGGLAGCAPNRFYAYGVVAPRAARCGDRSRAAFRGRGARVIAPEYCAVMARYNRWMNERLYALLADVSDDERKRDRGAFFGSMHGTLNHLLWGDRMWLGRFVGEPCTAPAFGADMYADFAQLRRERDATDRELLDWAAGVTTTWLASTLTYTSMVDGRTRELPAAVAAIHLFNHGTHHRGQLTTLLKQAGCDPGVTDLPWLPGVVRIRD